MRNNSVDKKIAIVIPIYNGQRFLGETLESVYAQEYSSFTVILCDDGSTDDSAGIISRTINSSTAIVHLIKHTKNLGPSVSIADLISTAKEEAEIAVILGHDDLLPPDYLRKINLEFNNPKTVLVTTSAIQIDEDSQRMQSRNSPPYLRVFGKYLPAFLLAANQITAPGVAFRMINFDPKFLGSDNPNTQDWIQWIYTSLIGKFSLCTRTNVFYRRHASSMTGKKDLHSAHLEISKSRLDFLGSKEFKDYHHSLNVLQKRIFRFLINFLFLEFSNCSHNSEFKKKLHNELFPRKRGYPSKVVIETCDSLYMNYTAIQQNTRQIYTEARRALKPDSVFVNVRIGVYFTMRIVAGAIWHAFIGIKRKLKNRLSQVTIYSTGGLGAQLSALSYALWIKDRFKRPVKIQFSEKGLTYYPIVVKQLLFEIRYGIVAADAMSEKSHSEPSSSRSTRWIVLFLEKELRNFKKVIIRILMTSRIIISSEHLSISSLKRITPHTRIVRGYHSDLRVIQETWELLANQFEKSSLRNFMIGSGADETIAIHWRLGDYLNNPHANFTHGTVSVDSILSCLKIASAEFAISDVRVFSDSPELAKSQLINYCNEFNFTFESGEIWDDLFEMSRSKVFIGSHSSISTWAAIAIAQANPSAGVYLPDKWFKNLPPGFETSDEEFLMPQDIFLNMKSYEVELL